MSERRNDIAVIGLGVMGANLARNFASRGLKVGVFNRTAEVGRKLVAEHPEADLDQALSLQELVDRLERPRRIFILVQAGPAVDAVIDQLDPLLRAGDVAIDAGNSLYSDTERRVARAADRPWQFLGMGVSGGAEGALKGPSLMPGGDRVAWDTCRPVLEAIAAIGPSGPCVTYCGAGSAGHFVKMVHNGIEYGDMQLIAEAASLLRSGLGFQPERVADTFGLWNQGVLASYLIEITERIFRFEDPERPGALLLDSVLDQVGQKGTGLWTVMAGLELAVPIPTIAAALDARVLSSARDLRLGAERSLEPRPRGVLTGLSAEEIGTALYASKLASYTQGFALLAAASRARKYGIDLSETARIWTAGCIIRATLLNRIREAFLDHPELPLLILAPGISDQIRSATAPWRKVVSLAAAAGHAIPGLSASLGWYETLTTGRGTGALLQAQRDYFGSHTYERIDRPGTSIHTDWGGG